MKKNFFAIMLIFSAGIFADTPTFENLQKADIENIMTELNASLLPTTVTPASSLGEYWGIEFGVIAGISESPEISSLAEETISYLPHAGFFGTLHLPFGIGFEYNFAPFESEGMSYDYKAYGIKWTVNDVITVIPFQLRLRLQKAVADISYSEVISLVNTNVSYSHKSLAVNVTASKKFLFVEPYILAGYTTSDNTLAATGSATFFDSSVTASDRSDVSLDSFYYFMGLHVDMFLLHLGAEFGKVYDSSRMTFKFSVAI